MEIVCEARLPSSSAFDRQADFHRHKPQYIQPNSQLALPNDPHRCYSSIMLSKQIHEREVVLVLPVADQKILMQLRDLKPEISAPGHWGFFGGAIDPGETALAAAHRELFEETGLTVDTIFPLGFKRVTDLENLPAHAFCCRMPKPANKLILQEGLDMTLASLEQVRTKTIFSTKLGRNFPVVPSQHIEFLFRQALQIIYDGQKTS